MKFYHSTTSENATSIVGEQEIYPSHYDLSVYIEQVVLTGWFTQNEPRENESMTIPQRFVDSQGEEHYLHWLGSGVYCFVETDLEQAIEYRRDHDAIIEIVIEETDMPINDIFSMDSRANRKKLKDFVTQGLTQLEEMQTDPDDKIKVEKFRKALETSLENNFRGTPHAAGIIIDLYRSLIEDFKLIKCTFSHGSAKKKNGHWFTQYVALKDISVIKELNQLQIE